MKTTIDLPPDLLRSASHVEIDLPDLIVRLLRRHLRKISKKSEPETPTDEHRDWREELL
ncbi:MAG: hypothetical protein ABIT37_17915 [Luteolibacter sp.]